ncbi:MAG: hypothetical protein EBT07_03180 [Actinobacteria bacterium]|nr:hypothetical protein [Actinomycetota bacterium]
MNTWILCLFLAVGVLVLLFFVKRMEGFENFLERNLRYTSKEDSYFHEQAGKEILINPGLAVDGINEALYQPDLDLAVSKDRDYSVYLQEDPYNGYIDRDSMCRNARYPKDMPQRRPRDTSGCGWWFHPDVPSMGAYGTIDGPLKTAGLPTGGQWTWDIPTAIMKEDIKFCKRIKNCDLMGIDSIAGKCGFCMRLGYAVPINANGSDKYPDSQTGACGEPTKSSPDECRPPPEPIVTNEGIDCGNYGSPSSDNRIRIYTNSECDALDGSWVPNGECLMKGGGSFSAACSELNSPLPATSPRTCDPGPTGALSRECLISLASGIGFTKSGAILANLLNGKPPGDTDIQAINMLATTGISIPDAVLGSGQTDVQTAGNTYSQIYSAMSSAPKEILREAAKWLVMGTDNFDVCNMSSDTSGPFMLSCLQQEFRKAGCQASGAAYPNTATASTYAKMSWGDVGLMFANLYKSMASKDPVSQDRATRECLGLGYYRPAPIGEYVRTDGGYDQSTGNVQCFAPTDLDTAKRNCDAQPNCRSFSFNTSQGGCQKTLDHVGFQNDGNFQGYTKKQYYKAPVRYANLFPIFSPSWRVRHSSFRAIITPINPNYQLDIDDSSFEIIDSLLPLGGVAAGYVSFRSKNYPKRVFRHRGFQLWLDEVDGSDMQARDSTFRMRPGLCGDSRAVSFESVNFPNYFLNVDNNAINLVPFSQIRFREAYACFLMSYYNA